MVGYTLDWYGCMEYWKVVPLELLFCCDPFILSSTGEWKVAGNRVNSCSQLCREEELQWKIEVA